MSAALKAQCTSLRTQQRSSRTQQRAALVVRAQQAAEQQTGAAPQALEAEARQPSPAVHVIQPISR